MIWNSAARKLNLAGSTTPPQSVSIRPGSQFVERNITVEAINSAVEIHKVSSAIGQIARLAFQGFDPVIIPSPDEPEARGKRKSEEALKKWKKLDRKIGDVGKIGSVGTLGLVRRTFMDTAGYKQAVFEYEKAEVDGWIDPVAIQWLPARTFNRAHSKYLGQDRYIPDRLLKGILYDTQDRRTIFNQTVGQNIVEISLDQVLYIEDALCEGPSYIGNLIPSIDQWLFARRKMMLAIRDGAEPKMNVELRHDLEGKFSINYDTLQKHAQNILKARAAGANAFVNPPGLQVNYPNVSTSMDSLEADAYLKKEILEHFFPRDWLEMSGQAISTTTAPLKTILDMLVSGHRETNGRPWERFWTQWLEENGFESYEFQLRWWDLTPKDILAERQQAREDRKAGILTIDEARKVQGLPPLDETQRQMIQAEKIQSQPQPFGLSMSSVLAPRKLMDAAAAGNPYPTSQLPKALEDKILVELKKAPDIASKILEEHGLFRRKLEMGGGNPCHNPPGSPEGGQFCSGDGGLDDGDKSKVDEIKDFDGLYNYWEKEHPHTKVNLHTENLKGIDLEVAKQVTVQFNRLADTYPRVAQDIFSIETKELGDHTWAAVAPVHSLTGVKMELILNQKFFNDRSKFEVSLKASEEKGIHPVGCNTIDSVITHEFGHCVWDYYTDVSKGQYALIDVVENPRFLSERGYGLGSVQGTVIAWNKEQRANGLSLYAKKPDRWPWGGEDEHHERFAEAFASLYHTPQEDQCSMVKNLGKLLNRISDESKWVPVKEATHPYRGMDETAKQTTLNKFKQLRQDIGLKPEFPKKFLKDVI